MYGFATQHKLLLLVSCGYKKCTKLKATAIQFGTAALCYVFKSSRTNNFMLIAFLELRQWWWSFSFSDPSWGFACDWCRGIRASFFLQVIQKQCLINIWQRPIWLLLCTATMEEQSLIVNGFLKRQEKLQFRHNRIVHPGARKVVTMSCVG